MSIPIVTLDKIYITPDNKNIYFLDCTRVNGSNEIVSRNKESLDSQIERLSKLLKGKQIILADDVVFSGSVLRFITNKFKSFGVEVVGIISSVSSSSGYKYFNDTLKYGLRTCFKMSDEVIDQICERDFYFGVAGSGIMVKASDGMYKTPYFKPYGNPCERASIPENYETFFSLGCIDRSIYLWEEIERLKKEKVLISELPERILNTSSEEEVVRTLKKARNRL